MAQYILLLYSAPNLLNRLGSLQPLLLVGYPKLILLIIDLLLQSLKSHYPYSLVTLDIFHPLLLYAEIAEVPVSSFLLSFQMSNCRPNLILLSLSQLLLIHCLEQLLPRLRSLLVRQKPAWVDEFGSWLGAYKALWLSQEVISHFHIRGCRLNRFYLVICQWNLFLQDVNLELKLIYLTFYNIDFRFNCVYFVLDVR